MNELSQTTLALFIEKADQLHEYIGADNHLGGLLGVYSTTNGDTWRLYPEIYGFVLNYRRFIQQEKKYDISLYPLKSDGSIRCPKLLDLADVSEGWKAEVSNAWQAGSNFLTLNLSDVGITRRTILDVFLYGEMIHTTQYETFKQWKDDPAFFGKVGLHFTEALGFTFFEYIRPLAEVSRRELLRQ
jgi:hypothetical protein